MFLRIGPNAFLSSLNDRRATIQPQTPAGEECSSEDTDKSTLRLSFSGTRPLEKTKFYSRVDLIRFLITLAATEVLIHRAESLPRKIIIRLCQPAIAEGFLPNFLNASDTTGCTDMGAKALIPASSWNSVLVPSGQSEKTSIPCSFSSHHRPSPKNRSYALLAA